MSTTHEAPSPSQVSLWLEGARLRTLPLSVAPVVAGTAAACAERAESWWRAGLCLLLALLLQVGINFANDYSDGVRGTDADRVGPLRLVGSGAVPPGRVKAAAWLCFAAAAVVGLVLSLASAWWLVLVGAAAIAAAWFYTGGPKPYGYVGLGEVVVFCFFGLVATMGTAFVQSGTLTLAGLAAALTCGFLACGVLVTNNLRDIPTDAAAGKRTLAVRLGDVATRRLFAALAAAAVLAVVGFAAATTWWALVAVLGAALLLPAVRAVSSRAVGPALIPALQFTGLAAVAVAVLQLVPVLLTR